MCIHSRYTTLLHTINRYAFSTQTISTVYRIWIHTYVLYVCAHAHINIHVHCDSSKTQSRRNNLGQKDEAGYVVTKTFHPKCRQSGSLETQPIGTTAPEERTSYSPRHSPGVRQRQRGTGGAASRRQLSTAGAAPKPHFGCALPPEPAL